MTTLGFTEVGTIKRQAEILGFELARIVKGTGPSRTDVTVETALTPAEITQIQTNITTRLTDLQAFVAALTYP